MDLTSTTIDFYEFLKHALKSETDYLQHLSLLSDTLSHNIVQASLIVTDVFSDTSLDVISLKDELDLVTSLINAQTMKISFLQESINSSVFCTNNTEKDL